MRKIIFILAAMALVVSCTQTRKWTDKEREEIRELVRTHKDRVAIRHMEESNYQNLEQCVLTTIEGTYPDYNQYNKLTGKTDTLNAVILSCLDYSIGPNFEKLPLLFPVSQLQQAGILPSTVSDEQAAAFYGCLAGKIKTIYGTPENFTSALFNDMDVPMELSGAMQECVASVTGSDSTTMVQPTPTVKKK